MCGWDSRAAVWASRVKRSPDVLLEGELGRQHLDGDPALEPLVPGAIDHAHPAAPDLALDRVGVAQGLGEARRQRLVGRVGHGRAALGRERGAAKAGIAEHGTQSVPRESGVESGCGNCSRSPAVSGRDWSARRSRWRLRLRTACEPIWQRSEWLSRQGGSLPSALGSGTCQRR